MKQLGLGSLWNLEDYLVSWLEMHFRKKISMCGNKIPIEGALHQRSHSIPLNNRNHTKLNIQKENFKFFIQCFIYFFFLFHHIFSYKIRLLLLIRKTSTAVDSTHTAVTMTSTLTTNNSWPINIDYLHISFTYINIINVSQAYLSKPNCIHAMIRQTNCFVTLSQPTLDEKEKWKN